MGGRKIVKLAEIVTLIVITYVIVLTVVYDLPPFGLSVPRVGQYYVEHTLNDVGAWNAVGAVIWDYRGYDTLGETLVLFAAVIVVIMLFRGVPREGNEHHR